MEVLESCKEINQRIQQLKRQGKKIGLVPTMGALHRGHISLIKESVNNNNFTVASIFVNPTQFNDKNDLIRYPRTLEKDLEMLKNADCSMVFTPSEEEMYPEPDKRIFNFGSIEEVMEGKSRKGHFNGVSQIVSKLFDAIPADNAYFGEKDFQQLAIIKRLVKDYKYPVHIVSCPIIREEDGLAISSRNSLLTEEERKNAVQISQILFKAQKLPGEKTVDEVKVWVVQELNKNNLFSVDYFEIVDDLELKPITEWSENKRKIGCVAVKVGKIRLIDNIKFNS